MSTASDKEILVWSLGQEAAVVTLDADFHTILAVSGASGPSVLRIRRQGLNALAVVELIEDVIADFQMDLTRGSLVTVKATKTTCHKLPIGGI
jgi:predicted nuclease of predicted toxin-antitoxin system